MQTDDTPAKKYTAGTTLAVTESELIQSPNLILAGTKRTCDRVAIRRAANLSKINRPAGERGHQNREMPPSVNPADQPEVTTHG